MKITRINRFFLLILLFLLSGCAGVSSNYDPPVIGINSFRLLPSETITPQFEIGLHLVNPNSESLHLSGIAYSVSLEDHKILLGVANDLPTIEPYGEGNITLVATADLLSGAKLLTSLLNNPRSSVSYTFSAKLDVGRFGPPIHIIEEGLFAPLENN
ncbi:MAG: LEA type 2 family protein [Desulforhopalus sp.]